MSIHFPIMRDSFSDIEYFDGSIWKNHDDTREGIRNDLPTVKLTLIKLAIYIDVSAHNRDIRLLTRAIMINRVIVIANGIPIMSYWKNHLVARYPSYQIDIVAKSIAAQFARAYYFSF